MPDQDLVADLVTIAEVAVGRSRVGARDTETEKPTIAVTEISAEKVLDVHLIAGATEMAGVDADRAVKPLTGLTAIRRGTTSKSYNNIARFRSVVIVQGKKCLIRTIQWKDTQVLKIKTFFYNERADLNCGKVLFLVSLFVQPYPIMIKCIFDKFALRHAFKFFYNARIWCHSKSWASPCYSKIKHWLDDPILNQIVF